MTPPPYRPPQDVIWDLIASHERDHPGEKPSLKWLAAQSGLSMGCVSAHRRAYYFTRRNTAPTEVSQSLSSPLE